MDYGKLILDVHGFIFQRLEHYFGKREDAPSAGDFTIKTRKKSSLYKFISEQKIESKEQLMLAVLLVPHLNPELFANLIHHFLPQGGELPIFGGAKGANSRGILPTGETLQFILAGNDVQNRLKMAEMLKDSILFRQGIVALETMPEGEAEMSGKLFLSREYLDLFLIGKMTAPSFGPDFPAQKIETRREWGELVLAEDVQQQINELQTWISHNEKLMQDWEMNRKLKPGYRVLFHGPSGTGKTLTATLLGKHTGRDVFRVDLSTIVSKYIGETEKNLEKLFSKAGNKDWILFFDEADALFGKRTEVNDSHDRYANQEVSYLLQRVEAFEGLVILSTNYKSNMDEAFLRRFNAIIKFPFPDAKLRQRIWETSFPEKSRLEKHLNIAEIAARYKLTGGNIINVVHWASLEAISKNTDIITLKSILHGIKREVEKEGKVFSGLRDHTVSHNGTP